MRKQVLGTFHVFSPFAGQGFLMWFMISIEIQAECDELAQRAEILKEENASLRAEVVRMRGEYDELLAQNKSLKVLPILETRVLTSRVELGDYRSYGNVYKSS